MDNLFDDSCAKSIAESLIVLYKAGVIPKDEAVARFVDKYLPEKAKYFKRIIEGIKNNRYTYTSAKIEERSEYYVQLLHEIAESDDLEAERKTEEAHDFKKSIKGEFNTGIYSLCRLLIDIDESLSIDEAFILNKSYGIEESAIYDSIHKNESICMIMLGTAQFSMDMNYKNDGELRGDYYNVSGNATSIIKNIRAFQEIKNGIDKLSDDRCYVFEINQLIDFMRIRKQFVLQKLLIALHFLRCSPEYKDSYKEWSYNLINIISSIIYRGEIYKIYLQEGYFDETINVQNRGADDYTTRLSIIMAMENEDMFILRIDLPHKGENMIHLNMEEVVGDSVIPAAMPFSYLDQKNTLDLLTEEEKAKLFFEMHNMYWFRTEAKTNIKKAGLSSSTNEAIEKLFKEQSHKSISITPSMETEFNSYMEELKKYIVRFGVEEGNLLAFTRETIDYQNEILKVRKIQDIYRNVNRVILEDVEENKQSTISYNNVARMFAGIIVNEDAAEANSVIDVWNVLQKI